MARVGSVIVDVQERWVKIVVDGFHGIDVVRVSSR
jgi:hypothetical protein